MGPQGRGRHRPGARGDFGDAAEITRLRAENAELRRANEILKAASAFFTAELDRPSKWALATPHTLTELGRMIVCEGGSTSSAS